MVPRYDLAGLKFIVTRRIVMLVKVVLA